MSATHMKMPAQHRPYLLDCLRIFFPPVPDDEKSPGAQKGGFHCHRNLLVLSRFKFFQEIVPRHQVQIRKFHVVLAMLTLSDASPILPGDMMRSTHFVATFARNLVFPSNLLSCRKNGLKSIQPPKVR